MHLKKKNDDYQIVDYFVRQKVRKGIKLTSAEKWAKEILDQCSQENRKIKSDMLYKTYHLIPKYVEVWEERINKKDGNTTKIKEKKKVYNYTHKARAKNLLDSYRYNSSIPFEELKPEEYKLICDWLEKGIPLPDYLGTIIYKKPSLKERIEFYFDNTVKELIIKIQNISFLVFLGYFFMMLMLINL